MGTYALDWFVIAGSMATVDTQEVIVEKFESPKSDYCILYKVCPSSCAGRSTKEISRHQYIDRLWIIMRVQASGHVL